MVDRALRESADVAAEVSVAGDVLRVRGDRGRVGVAVAVLEPGQPARLPVGSEAPLDVAPGAVDVARTVEARAVRREARDAGVGAGVADRRVHRPGQALAGRGVEGGDAVAGVRLAVHRRERSTGDDLGTVGSHHEGVHRSAESPRSPGGQAAVRRRDGGRADAGLAVHGREGPTEVDGGPARGERAHGVVHGGAERGRRRPGRRVQLGDVVVGGGADLRKGSGDVDALAVGRGDDRLDLAVELRGEGGVEDAGDDVVRQQVPALDRLRARGGTGGTGGRELAPGVDGGTDDGLRGHEPVDLRRRERVGRDGRRCRRVRGVLRRRVGGGRLAARKGARDEQRRDGGGGREGQAAEKWPGFRHGGASFLGKEARGVSARNGFGSRCQASAARVHDPSSRGSHGEQESTRG